MQKLAVPWSYLSHESVREIRPTEPKLLFGCCTSLKWFTTIDLFNSENLWIQYELIDFYTNYWNVRPFRSERMGNAENQCDLIYYILLFSYFKKIYIYLGKYIIVLIVSAKNPKRFSQTAILYILFSTEKNLGNNSLKLWGLIDLEILIKSRWVLYK